MSEKAGYRHDLFVSHARADRERVAGYLPRERVITPASLVRGYGQFADLLAQVYAPEVDDRSVPPIVLRTVCRGDGALS